jgi:uncharacterized phage protein gp47/JayE
MTNTTSVPSITFTPTGLVLPQESAVLAGVQADLSGAFGGNLNPGLNTPQGQLASSQTACIADVNATFALYVNQIDPDTASGFMQDAIARIYFLNRSPGAPTAVECTCVGLFGTVIPVGAQAQDSSGNRYVCTQAGTIPIGGSLSLPFANIADGPTPCPASTLTTIYQAILGWESITNPADGVLGANVETQAAFAYRRTQSVALNAHGSLAAIYAAVFDVENVIDVYVTENPTSSAVAAGSTSYSLAPHSLYVAAIGGASADIAQAIWTKKDVGCDMNGNTTVTVTDLSGYLPPYPTYAITYETPAALPILFAVEISASSALPSNIVALTQNAIIAAFTGADGSARVRIGSLLLASKFYAPIVALGAEVSVISILLGSSTPTLTSQLIGIDQAPTVIAGNITVTLV